MPRGDAKAKVLASAERLFSGKWYSTVSVADICRQAGVSNGIAYHYFRDKEEIFLALMDRTIDVVGRTPRLNGSDDTGERLGNYIADLLKVTVDNKHLIRAFRQGQYRHIEYERKLRDIYTDHLGRVLGRPVADPEYVYILSGLRFTNIRHAIEGQSADLATLKGIAACGAFPEEAARPIDEFLPKRILPPAVELEQDTAMRLKKAGKELFGRCDFSAVSVAEITRAAGTSVGTFYNCFDSKEGFLAEIITGISREIRRFIAVNMPKGLTRLEEEIAGVYLFSLFLTFDPDCYPVVRQAEYVVPEAARDYYEAFKRGYLARMDWLPEGWDRETAANYLMGIAHYFGLEFAYARDIKDAKGFLSELMGYYTGGCCRRSCNGGADKCCR